MRSAATRKEANRMKRVSSVLLCAALLLSLAVPARAAAATQEAETAGAYLSEKGILLGDATGDLKLDRGLTRAELAAILTRLNGGGEDVTADPAYYAGMCYFIDVPEWAKPYVGYCADSYLMNGYDLFHFGADDAVSPGMACTVTLRYLAVPETDWNYSTALVKASGLGLAPAQGMEIDAITRGNMSILLYRALTQSTGGTVPTPTAPPSSVPAGSTKDHPKVLDGGNWAREDFSQQANPAIFDGVYTRAAYNAARQTIVDREAILAGVNDKGYNPSYTYGYTTASAETRRVMEQVLARFSEYHDYATGVEPYLEGIYNYPDYFICKVQYHNTAAAEALAETIAELRAMSSDTDRVRRINDIVCDKLTYDENGYAMPGTVFTSTGVSRGKCTNYAHAFLFLCNMVDIPCIYITGNDHAWNETYVDGQWLITDATSNDVEDDPECRDAALMKAVETNPARIDEYPEITAFAKELLVPGSTR